MTANLNPMSGAGKKEKIEEKWASLTEQILAPERQEPLLQLRGEPEEAAAQLIQHLRSIGMLEPLSQRKYKWTNS